jgi:hypothetical protein
MKKLLSSLTLACVLGSFAAVAQAQMKARVRTHSMGSRDISSCSERRERILRERPREQGFRETRRGLVV